TFVAGADARLPHDLREAAARLDGDQLGAWLKTILLPSFGKTWWLQRRSFRFPVWAEYDWLLPPLLTLDYMPIEEIPHDQPNITIKDPVRRERLAGLNFGTVVIIEDFTVQRIYRDRGVIQLALGKGSDSARRAFRVEIRGVNLAQDAYYRGEIVEYIAGRIAQTRAEQLAAALRALHPPFEPTASAIPGLDAQHPLPNPIIAFDRLLDRQITGSLSKIHGDLHLGNILIGIQDSPFLIDFAQTRDGHTAFDWAWLEISLIRERLGPIIGTEWNTAWGALKAIDTVHRRLPVVLPAAFDAAVRPIAALQDIIDTCLIRPGDREEFYVALALAALRAMTWAEMPIGCRRLMVGLAALSIAEVLNSARTGGPSETISADATEVDSR
ncbi:MAG: aminoglycoside phosphotransferase family protein, partial [Anaerolinea sp.]|nr:aminoglycoside phosphotransferase family protein [Anaerolinea sp.]